MFNPLRNEGDMFRVLIFVVVAAVLVVAVVLIARAL
jgi:hypothetical protein